MKNLNSLSKILEDEIKLKHSGISADAVEEAVLNILNSVHEQIDGISFSDDFDGDDAEIEDLFFVTSPCKIVSAGKEYSLTEGSYISIDAFDASKSDVLIVSLFDAEGELVAEDVEVTEDFLEEMVEKGVLELASYEEELEEGFVIRGGKKVKISAKMEKLKKKLAAKKGSGVNKFTIKHGKIVKKSA
jgi:hypothetical protein